MRILRIVSKFLIFVIITGLLFACNVFSKNTPVSGVTYVTPRGNPRVNSIVWSPKDSTKILVSAIGFLRNDSQVYILDIATKKKTMLIDTDYSGVIGDGWSPDGKQVALSVSGTVKRFSQGGLWMMNTEDNSLKLFSNNPSGIVWLPDGNTAAFIDLDLASGQNPRRIAVYLMNIQTKESKLIYSNREAISSSGLSSSPDGKYLVFSLDFGDSSPINNLYILNLQTGTVKQLTYEGASSSPQWSPAGDLIAYVKSNKIGDKTIHSLHIFQPDGSCDLETPNVEYAFSLTWSPDGRKIGFIGEEGIYVLDTDIVFGRDIYQNLCP